MGAVGLGRVEARSGRLTGWLALVLVLAALNYASRFTEGKPPKDILYQWSNAIGGLIQYAVILGIVLVIARGEWDWLALRRPRSLRGSLGGIAVVLVSVYLLRGIISPLLHPGREQGLTPDRWDSSRAVPFFANAVVICVVAPFVEELTFRGAGYSLIAMRFGVEPAIVGSAVLFGLAHGLVEALPLLVALGIGLAWLRERQDSVIPGMILHGTFNALALVVSLTT
jgi:CAAX protease family protein